MKRILKYFVLLIAIIGGLFYAATNHSITDEIQIVCKGSFYRGGKALGEEKIYFKFQKYRWWVRLWGDRDGVGYVQTSDGRIDSLSDIKILNGWGDVVFDKIGGGKKGRYSAMSKTMNYVFGGLLFVGKCVDKKQEQTPIPQIG